MKKQRLMTLLAATMLTLACSSCGSDDKKTIELAGTAWSGSTTFVDEGEQDCFSVTLICSSSSQGTLFLREKYGNDPETDCLVMPFSYQWADNQGTMTATLLLPDEWKKNSRLNPAKGTTTYTMTISYSDADGLLLDIGRAAQLFELSFSTLHLNKTSISSPSTLAGTRWVAEFDGTTMDWDYTAINVHYLYELQFVSNTTARLDMTMSEDGDDEATEHWNVNYTFQNGIGHTVISFDDETLNGGFYLPDASHLLFTDGETGLDFVKQQ